MKVRYGQHLFYVPNLLDRIDGRTSLTEGDEVVVIKVSGCPAANVVGHCYVGDPNDADKFIGMVHTNSLHTRSDYVQYLREKIAAHEQGA